MTGRLTGKVALVSGGARGMGESHARGFLAEGARVVIGDVLADEGAALARELGAACAFAPLDVTDAQAWADAVALAEQRYGPVDVLVNNAGVVAWKPTLDTSAEEFRRTLEVNLVGVFNGMRAAIPSMRRAGGGVIVNISSTAGMMGFAYEPGYVASKWGVRGLTKAAALEFGPDGIRVMSVHPGAIRTPMTADVDETKRFPYAIARMGDPAEVTKLVLFLAADATYCTGSEFVIDGGSLLGPVVPVPVGTESR